MNLQCSYYCIAIKKSLTISLRIASIKHYKSGRRTLCYMPHNHDQYLHFFLLNFCLALFILEVVALCRLLNSYKSYQVEVTTCYQLRALNLKKALEFKGMCAYGQPRIYCGTEHQACFFVSCKYPCLSFNLFIFLAGSKPWSSSCAGNICPHKLAYQVSKEIRCYAIFCSGIYQLNVLLHSICYNCNFCPHLS